MAKQSGGFEGLLQQRYRSPRKGDRLFRSEADWTHAVEFSTDEFVRQIDIWRGYMQAGAALIDACSEDSPARDSLIYPALFNYRHGIEVAMKFILACHEEEPPADETEPGHNLWKLWKRCKEIILEAVPEDSDGSIAAVEQVIKDLHDVDKGAQAFRYSEDKKGAVMALPREPINFRNIRDVMEGVTNFFIGVDAILDFSTAP